MSRAVFGTIGDRKRAGRLRKQPPALGARPIEEAPPVTHRTYFQRLRIRTWTFLSNWTERRLVAAYDRLVDVEQR